MKIVAFDIDDVICYRPKKEDDKINGIEKYHSCIPIDRNIRIVNECYKKGYYIKLYTSRGMTYFSGSCENIKDNLFTLTTEQMRNWGVKYHELIMCKTHYDLLIDDKTVNIADVKEVRDIEKYLF